MMKNKETVLSITFGLLGIVAWYFPSIEVKYKVAVTFIVGLSIALILYKDRLSYFFRKYWPEIISIALFLIFYIIFKNAFPELLIPAIAILLGSISISLLISFKYAQTFIYKARILLRVVAINDEWILNHWGSTCAKIENNKMIFSGASAPNGTDGSHINLINALEIGRTYEISCNVKSTVGTTGMFQLWCHDKINNPVNGVSEATAYKIPSTSEEKIKLIFKANFNEDIRIHLQYTPGIGEIQVSDVNIFKLSI